MTNYEIYVLTITLTVFAIFTVLFTVMIAYLTKFAIKLIRYGDDDELIARKREYLNKKTSKPSKFATVFSLCFSVILIAIFVLTLCISCTNDNFESGFSSIKIVKSDSMSKKNEKNLYLFQNNLNDQFLMFDLVVTKPLPPEDELKLYDIVVYERDDMLIIHRIVGIEEPNEKHSERHFMLQGDAVSRHDVYPVLYSQMKAFYDGNRVPFVGSIIVFLQSPAGWLCFILVLTAILISPIVEKKLIAEMKKRLAILDGEDAAKEEEAPEPEYDYGNTVKIRSVMANPYAPYAPIKSKIKFTVCDVLKGSGVTKLVIKDNLEEEKPNRPERIRIKLVKKTENEDKEL